MNTYNIWAEGYRATGQSGEAVCLERGMSGKSFSDACVFAFEGDPYFNRDTLTYWGCRLYDNREAAEREFG